MARGRIDDARIGTQIAERYRLDRIIGRGGMGTVYGAVHLWTGRPVAVKLLVAEEPKTMSQRLLAEARAAAAVRHPHLVEVLDVGIVEEDVGGERLLYLVLELLDGETLRAHLKRRRTMRAEHALDVIVPILDALEALHRAKIIHRDVKPANIFLCRDGRGRIVPKLLDLGISKRLDAQDKLTMTGALMGTPSYMSPEQARGLSAVGPGIDIWAVGVILFECLTGRVPFHHETTLGLLHLIATERPPPIASVIDELPGVLAGAVDRALAYEPADRHGSAAELADALVNAALDAGWPLTCRIPSGPMISLAPTVPADSDPLDRTPVADPNMTPLVTPRSSEPPPGPSGEERAASTRDQRRSAAAAPSEVESARAPDDVSEPRATGDPSASKAGSAAAPGARTAGEGSSGTDPEPPGRAEDVSHEAIPPRRSRLGSVLAVAVGVAVGGVGVLAWGPGESPRSEEATAAGRPALAPESARPVEASPRTVEPAPPPTVPVAVELPATTEPAGEVRPPRGRAARADRARTDPVPEALPERGAPRPEADATSASSPPRLGPNGAPIILDRPARVQ